ncbi:alpha/beta hydrolase, partial [Burkholderia cenocepacia]|nr:alpha/beta hydrolase [Burkholderia cenocepacia]
MKDKPDGVVLPSRVVPFPTSISDEARAALQRLTGDDGVPLNALHVMPAPDDIDAWMRVKASADAHYAAAVEQLAGYLRSSVETIRVGDADVHVATPEAEASSAYATIDLHGGALVVGG